jgi:hypothetical protein
MCRRSDLFGRRAIPRRTHRAAGYVHRFQFVGRLGDGQVEGFVVENGRPLGREAGARVAGAHRAPGLRLWSVAGSIAISAGSPTGGCRRDNGTRRYPRDQLQPGYLNEPMRVCQLAPVVS